MKTELRKLVTKLEQKMSSQYPINLLMLVEREGYANFRLMISSDTLKSDLTTNRFLSKELAKILSQEEFKILSRVEVVDSRSKFFIETRDYLENNGNPEELYNLEFGGLKITRALVIVSPVVHSKKYVQKAELEQMLIQLKQFLEREYVTKDELKQWITQKENVFTLSSEKQNQLSFSQKTLQDERKTIFKPGSING